MKAATRKLVKGVHVGKLGLLQLLHVEKWELKVALEDTVERCKQSKDDHDDYNGDYNDDDNDDDDKEQEAALVIVTVYLPGLSVPLPKE